MCSSTHADVAMVAVVGVPGRKVGRGRHGRDGVANLARSPNAEALIDLVKQRKGSTHAPKHIEVRRRAAA